MSSLNRDCSYKVANTRFESRGGSLRHNSWTNALTHEIRQVFRTFVLFFVNANEAYASCYATARPRIFL